jgi:hypothetical protein
MWSTIQPSHRPLFLPVDGQGFARWNVARTTALRFLAIEAGGVARCVLGPEGFLAWTLGVLPEDEAVPADTEASPQTKTNKLATERQRAILKLLDETRTIYSPILLSDHTDTVYCYPRARGIPLTQRAVCRRISKVRTRRLDRKQLDFGMRFGSTTVLP